MIKILLITISFFVLLFVESFLLRVFSFSLFAVVVLSMWKRVNDILFYTFLTLFGIVLDCVLQVPLGTHILVLTLLFLLLEFLWLLVPVEGKFGYIPIFFFVFLYYLLIPVVSSLLSEGVFPSLLSSIWIEIFVKSVISVGMFMLINRFTKSLRDNKSRGVIRLS